jgi:hypothetical protein
MNSSHFDIHQKLKQKKGSWCFMLSADEDDNGVKYKFMTKLIGSIEYAIYERIDDNFYLVDFFGTYAEASDMAKLIIDSSADIKKTLS